MRKLMLDYKQSHFASLVRRGTKKKKKIKKIASENEKSAPRQNSLAVFACQCMFFFFWSLD